MRSFFTIWIGQAVSLLGSQLVQFAMVWWLTTKTGSATVLALASLAALLPQILIGPFAGALVDRWSRKTVMVAADTGIALATLVLAVLFWLDTVAVWNIYVLLLVRATGAAFHWPAMQASTTLMVPQKHLSRIAGLNQTLSGLAGILIPPLGALAIEVLPMQGVLAIDLATATVAVVALLFIAVPQPGGRIAAVATGRKPSLWVDMREGLHFVLSWKALMMLSAIGVVVNTLGRAAASLTPLLVIEHFGGGALELGWWQSAVGVGSVIGGISLGVWGGFRRRVVTQMLALAVDGLAIMAIGLSPRDAFPLAVVIIFFTGFLEAVVLGLSGAIFQTIIPPEVQGRVFSLLISISQGLSPLGLVLAGPTADAFGVPFWWVLTGIIIAAMGAGAFLVPAVVYIEDHAYQT
jgi:DHA3 family macrolide efflux protein-like MFS transporter